MPSMPYGSICPISKASEILGPRWTIQILCEMWAGSSRFNDIRRGLGRISPTLLSRRLKEMEAAGLVERVEDRGAGTVDYFRTASAIELEPALDALARWAQRNVEAEVAISDPDLSSMMWEVRRYVGVANLPHRRVVARFHFADVTSGHDCYWLVAQPGVQADICATDPGVDVDLFLETTVASFAATFLGRTTIAREVEEGRMFLSGDARLVRTIAGWFPKEEYSEIDGIARFDPPQRAGLRSR